MHHNKCPTVNLYAKIKLSFEQNHLKGKNQTLFTSDMSTDMRLAYKPQV